LCDAVWKGEGLGKRNAKLDVGNDLSTLIGHVKLIIPHADNILPHDARV